MFRSLCTASGRPASSHRTSSRILNLAADEPQQGFEIPAEAHWILLRLAETRAIWWKFLQLSAGTLANAMYIGIVAVPSSTLHDALKQRLAWDKALFPAADDVFAERVVGLVETKYLLASGIGNLFFAKLRPVEDPSLRFKIYQFINATESGSVYRGGQGCTHAKRIDGRLLCE